MIVPKGYVFNCPCCGKPLYKVSEDISLYEEVLPSINKIVAIYPQPLVYVGSLVVQKCHYCNSQFDLLMLVKTYFLKGIKSV